MDCSNVTKIIDVTSQVKYTDTHDGGRGDSNLVSCGQDGNYNELKDKYNKYFKGKTEESWMAKMMCQCCKKLKPTGQEKVSWLKFYECLKSKVSSDTPKTLKILKELIEYHK